MLDESKPVDKLCFIVVSDTDAGKLSEQMSSKGFASTKIGSSGGFLPELGFCGQGGPGSLLVGYSQIRDSSAGRRRHRGSNP